MYILYGRKEMQKEWRKATKPVRFKRSKDSIEKPVETKD